MEFRNVSSNHTMARAHHIAFTGINGAATNNILIDYTIFWEYIPDPR